MEHFGESARRVIARAVELAQEVGAEELLPEHLLISFEDHESIRQLQMEVRRELVRRRASPAPPPFNAQVLEVFEKAYRIAPGPIEAIHLMMSMSLGGRLAGLMFSDSVLQNLAGHGVDTVRLRRMLEGRDLLAHLPDRDFWRSPAGQRVADLVVGCPDPTVYTLLFGLLLRGGPMAEDLASCGLSEPILIAILTNFSADSVEALLASADLGELADGLGRVARVALVVGWNCSQRQVLGAQNLLDGLLCADMLCQPGQGATGILRMLGVLGFAHSETRGMVMGFESERRVLEVSEEVREAVAAARDVAGGPVGTEHLLYGLSRTGLEELRRNLVLPDRIQQNFG